VLKIHFPCSSEEDDELNRKTPTSLRCKNGTTFQALPTHPPGSILSTNWKTANPSWVIFTQSMTNLKAQGEGIHEEPETGSQDGELCFCDFL
jgi:hypothetical protein